MIGRASLVRYIGEGVKYAWKGKLLQVHDRRGNEVEVYTLDKKGKWITFTLPIKDVEEVC